MAETEKVAKKGKVIEGQYGLRVLSDGEYYRVNNKEVESFKRYIDGGEITFWASTSEYKGKVYRWASLVRSEKDTKEQTQDNEMPHGGYNNLYQLYQELKQLFEGKQ